MTDSFPRIAALKTAAAFREHLRRSNIALDFDDDLLPPAETPLARPFELDGVRVGNRFCVLPMEGWDGTPDGRPSELTIRRWRNFGLGGAKLFWGGEAVAVRHDGRANPNQLLLTEANHQAIAGLRDTLIAAHREKFGSNADGDVFLGLQLTHSGRWSRPNVFDRPEPLAAVPNPVLDRRVPAGVPVLSDDDLDRLVEDFVAAARLAASPAISSSTSRHATATSGTSCSARARGRAATAARRSRTACASCATSSRRCAPRFPA